MSFETTVRGKNKFGMAGQVVILHNKWYGSLCGEVKAQSTHFVECYEYNSAAGKCGISYIQYNYISVIIKGMRWKLFGKILATAPQCTATVIRQTATLIMPLYRI